MKRIHRIKGISVEDALARTDGMDAYTWFGTVRLPIPAEYFRAILENASIGNYDLTLRPTPDGKAVWVGCDVSVRLMGRIDFIEDREEGMP